MGGSTVAEIIRKNQGTITVARTRGKGEEVPAAPSRRNPYSRLMLNRKYKQDGKFGGKGTKK